MFEELRKSEKELEQSKADLEKAKNSFWKSRKANKRKLDEAIKSLEEKMQEGGEYDHTEDFREINSMLDELMD